VIGPIVVPQGRSERLTKTCNGTSACSAARRSAAIPRPSEA